MSTKYFNFNNEADLTPIEVNDETGVVEFTLDGQVATFESVQEFAEFYALARNVVPDNLKNWTLTEDGNHVAFVLRAGTAGLDAEEITKIATGLRAAGMSPEEIGRAISSAQTTETHKAQLDKQEETASDIVERVVSEFTTDPVNKLALVSLYSADNLMHDIAQDTSLFTAIEIDNVDNFDEFEPVELPEYTLEDTFYSADNLMHDIAQDTSLFTAIEIDNVDNFDEFEPVELPEYTLEDTFRHNLSTRIQEKIAELSDVYPNVPALTALRIDTGIDDDEASRNDLHRAQIVASLASRSVAVHVITIIGDHNVHIHNGFANDEDVVQLLAQDGTKVSKDSGRFYIYNVA